MRCPICGFKSQVVDTRKPRRANTLRRRRKCTNGHLFTTHETIVHSEGPRA